MSFYKAREQTIGGDPQKKLFKQRRHPPHVVVYAYSSHFAGGTPPKKKRGAPFFSPFRTGDVTPICLPGMLKARQTEARGEGKNLLKKGTHKRKVVAVVWKLHFSHSLAVAFDATSQRGRNRKVGRRALFWGDECVFNDAIPTAHASDMLRILRSGQPPFIGFILMDGKRGSEGLIPASREGPLSERIYGDPRRRNLFPFFFR